MSINGLIITQAQVSVVFTFYNHNGHSMTMCLSFSHFNRDFNDVLYQNLIKEYRIVHKTNKKKTKTLKGIPDNL